MKRAIFVLSLVTPLLAFAQIQISSSEIPTAVGTNWTADLNDSITLDVGTAGGSHVWDFTSYPAGSDTIVDTIIAKNNSPFGDSFPSANEVEIKIDKQNSMNSKWSYHRLVQDSIIMLGQTFMADTSTQLFRFTPPCYIGLPLTYNDEWVMNTTGSLDMGGSVTMYLNSKIHLKVDGYGQIQLPYKTFDCLRVIEYDTVIMSIPSVMTDTTTSIIYQFWAENYGVVATITSMAGETNPNFTTGDLERMTNQTGIEERNTPEQKAVSLYPNPFYNSVDIKYSLVNSENVSLKIYDVSGNLVSTLINNSQSAGEHNMLWNAKNTNGTKVPAGIYFYELKTPTEKIRNKIILLK
jgi:hypothetical protein